MILSIFESLDYTTYSLQTITYFWDLTLMDYSDATFSLKSNSFFAQPTSSTVPFTAKLVLCVCLLIVLKGGVPRYRYDFLTKMGWVKFLTFIVSLFFLVLTLNLFL